MPIPQDILSVPRPKNTVVIAYGKDKSLYAVRQRIGCRNDNGRHLPVNGPTIGHIIDGVYVPIDKDLCDRLFSDIRKELSAVYSQTDVMKMYCISILRVCDPGVKNYELKEAYETSFLSELYPRIALSKNTVSSFLNDMGKSVSKIVRFMQNRASAVSMDHHLLIDGTLKSDGSRVNSLSDFSRKASFDLEAMEPVCSKCFPGNMLDATSYSAFISENRITKGIIVGDKGFPESAAHEHFEANEDLHYLNPIKRNSKLIERHHMLDFTGILPGYEGITFRKEKCTGTDKWLYSYRDSKTYSLEALREKQKTFGTIVLECDLNLPAETAYKAYEKRWEIEIVMRFYKSACEFDETRVQDDYSVIGSEFCDFLSTLLTFRLIKAFDNAKLLEDRTYKKIMSVLTRAKKVRSDGETWQLIRLNPSYEEILQELGLIPRPEEPPKKKPGRPKGSKNKSVIKEQEAIPVEGKRKRGRHDTATGQS